MHTRIKTVRKKLTAKFCEHPDGSGKYLDFGGPCPQLYFIVGPDGKSGSWLVYFHLNGKRHEMGLGTFPEVSLAQARIDGGVARGRAKQGFNPIEERRDKRHQDWLAEAKNKNFLAIAEDFIDMKSRGPNPWWCKERADDARNILHRKFKSLHQLPINSAEAAEVITLKLHELLMAPVTPRNTKRESGPRWFATPEMAKTMKALAYGIGQRAHGLKVLPISVANPAGEPLDALLTEKQPKGGQLAAMPYQQVPAVYHTLDQISRSTLPYFTASEAARAIGKYIDFVRRRIPEEIPASKDEPSSPSQIASKVIDYEWRIDPAVLYSKYEMVVDVIPGVQPVVFDLIKMCALTGPRPSEMRLLRWGQYDENERLVVIRWQETKEGEHFEQNMVIALSEPANDIIMKMQDIQRRYRIPTPYVFANFPSRFNTNAIIGQPPSHATALYDLRKVLPPEYIKATMHGFRTNIRSWAEDQRRPDGLRRFDEKDLERAIGHAAGFGETKVERIYTRQSSDVVAVAPIFDAWARYVTSGGKPGDVIYDIPFRRKASTGG